ncbi:MAG TPA: D-glycerate dehydrogenase [Clostridia bacterium]|nr:D-glycerate dehydrogenase [Clostridia bacterium]
MNKPKIYIAQIIPREVESYIAQFCDYEKWEGEQAIPRSELLDKLSDKDGVLLSGFWINEELLNRAPKLRVISNVSVGYNNFDLQAMKERNIIGTNTPGVLDNSVADLIFGLILSSARRIAELERYVKEGNWKRGDNENLFGMDVHHSTLGIIGMGRIGEAVAKRAKFGFDMEVCYHNRNRKKDVEKRLGVEYCDFKSLLAKSDFIVLMTPLSDETRHIIDFEEFNIMKNTAIFINASRGQTVNEQALIEALQSKKIRGAGLDVYEKEPVNPENPLLKMSNVVTVPHIGSATEKTRFDMAMLAAENLVKALYGELPPNIVPELHK